MHFKLYFSQFLYFMKRSIITSDELFLMLDYIVYLVPTTYYSHGFFSCVCLMFFFQNNNDTIYYFKWSVWSSLPFSPKWPSFMNNQEKAKIVIPLWKFLNLKDAKKWLSVCGWKCGNKGAKNYFQFIADYIANYVLHLYLGLKGSAVHFGSHIGGIVFCGRHLDALVVHDGHETNFFAQTKLKICE